MDDLNFDFALAGASDKDLIRLLRWLTKCDSICGVPLERTSRDGLLDEVEYQRHPPVAGMYQ